MPRKVFIWIIVSVLLASSLLLPGVARAGGYCGGTYIVQWGDTLTGVAQRCGVTIEAILAANPGISQYLYAGQTLVIPSQQSGTGSAYAAYVVQPGDTFAAIAARLGVSVNALAAANPHIRDINVLYPGQVIYTPASGPSMVIVPTPTPYVPVPLSVGIVRPGTPTGSVKLVNKTHAQIYVSLQGTMQNGDKIIREHPFSRMMTLRLPTGWYVYVAWVGGQKFSGQFRLSADQEHTLTFYENRVVLE